MVDLTSYFQSYEKLRDKVAKTFDQEKVNGTSRPLCGQDSDSCCYGYFEISLMEAVYLFHRMNQAFSHEHREAVIARAIGVQEEIQILKKNLPCHKDGAESSQAVFKQAVKARKIRCPLNDGSKCLLFDHRPLRCLCDGIADDILGAMKIDASLDRLSRHLFWALSEQSPQGNGLTFSVADTVSGQFAQDYFNYLGSL